ncbi:DNA-binding transcriptional regulator, Lrp family [Bowdeniella nasicola]|uniref:DNA-binding transcriptional regulator, Lrp family n=1 Tax=Bowdeniella nasicola TaxID=208480 RepID=A0A1H3ZKR4_9ACTO|nr:DNA-binding transcriptional regulator, Lrp family [Bowdeniella nasicola]
MRRSALSPTRRAHEDQLLELLRHHGPLTRGQLSELSGITRSTVSEIVTDMLNRRAITLDGNDTECPGRGRRAERIALDPSAGQYLGIEFAHDGACFQLANASLSVIAQRHCIYPFNAPWDVRLRMARQTIDELSDLPHNGQRRSLQDVIRETIHAALSPNATVVVQNNVQLAAPPPARCLLPRAKLASPSTRCRTSSSRARSLPRCHSCARGLLSASARCR